MIQEEKQLLLKDICAKLPYGTYVHHKNCPNTKFKVIAVFDDGRIGVTENGVQLTPTSINECKPYLRPMSSMTEEEESEYSSMFSYASVRIHCTHYDTVQEDNIPDFIDWLNAHHFDYRGLIEKGLALEAPEEMYKED